MESKAKSAQQRTRNRSSDSSRALKEKARGSEQLKMWKVRTRRGDVFPSQAVARGWAYKHSEIGNRFLSLPNEPWERTSEDAMSLIWRLACCGEVRAGHWTGHQLCSQGGRRWVRKDKKAGPGKWSGQNEGPPEGWWSLGPEATLMWQWYTFTMTPRHWLVQLLRNTGRWWGCRRNQSSSCTCPL